MTIITGIFFLSKFIYLFLVSINPKAYENIRWSNELKRRLGKIVRRHGENIDELIPVIDEHICYGSLIMYLLSSSSTLNITL